MQWVCSRLIPAFKAKYGEKKMVLVLDNASTHKQRPEGQTATPLLTKKAAVKWLQEHGITEACDIEIASFSNNRPSREELLRWCLAKDRELHPQSYEYRYEVEKSLREYGYEVLFLPPYASVFNPIEKLWRHMKEQIRNVYESERSEEEIKECISKAIYGLEGFKSFRTGKYFADMLAYAGACVSNDEELTGQLGVGVPVSRINDAEEVEPLVGDDQAFKGEAAGDEEGGLDEEHEFDFVEGDESE